MLRTPALAASGLCLVLACGDDQGGNPGGDTALATAHAGVEAEDADARHRVSCHIPKSDVAFANAVTQHMYGRELNSEERERALTSGFDRPGFVDEVLASSEADNGLSRFLTNLFQLGGLTPDDDLRDEELVADTILVSQLKQEPIQLVLRNKDKPWPWFFTTRDIFCTEETARIYDYPLVNTNGFVSCELPANRAGFLGLASVLRAVPSDFVSVNNNYKRVGFMLYLTQGLKLLAATNGPEGEGVGKPLPACVPSTDMRMTPDGLAFGTARIPTEGSTCAGCHSVYNGPLSVAFRPFREDGTTFSLGDFSRIPTQERSGASVELLEYLADESTSCWSPDTIAPAQIFHGLPGLAELIATTPTLGAALGFQIPQMLGNIEPDGPMREAIEEEYNQQGETLQGALRGYFLSPGFQCAQQDE